MIVTYVTAALCYGVAGIVLAGYVNTPNTDAGNPYLLSTITAVVLGGTALGGGRGRSWVPRWRPSSSASSTFLSASGAPSSVALLVQSGAIAFAAVLGGSATIPIL